MRLAPCRFFLPLVDNDGQPIEPQVIVDLQRELLAKFGGFTIHPTIARSRFAAGDAAWTTGYVFRRAAAVRGHH